MARFLLLCILFWPIFGQSSAAQTITPDESTVVLQAPKKIGINLNGPTYYQGGELYKNLLWRNPGFEPDLYRQKFVAFTAGTNTTFPSPDLYDPVAANFWAGASFSLYRGLPRTVACSGTVASNTVSVGNKGPVYTFASPCASAVQEGDVILLRKAIACTDEAVWENQGAGWWGTVANGGKLLSECVAPYDGVQSLRLDASVAGSSAGVRGYVDTNPSDVGILLNGQFTVSGMYRTVGSPVFSVDARRLVSSATGNPFTCAAETFAPSSTWTSFNLVCTGTETKQLTPGPVVVTLTGTGGVVLVDNVSFQKSAGLDPTNTTVFRDELLSTLRAHCAGASLSTVPCELRDWAFQNADEIDNTVKPIFERRPSLAGTNYDVPPNGATGSMSVGLEEFLQLCRLIAAEPYYAMPETTGPEDAAAWIEYLNGAPSTPYGARRAANGQTASWLSVFPTIHLPMGNENWNEGGGGQGLGYRIDAPDYYYDYSMDAAGVWAAMRSGASWPAGGTGIDLVLGFQDGNPNYGVAEAMARANPNSGELAPYTQAYVGDTGTLPALWNPLFYEVVANTTNPAMTFYQQGSAVKAHGRLNVYEFDNGTSQGSSSLTQSVLDTFTDAAGYGTATALQALQHLTFGIVDQNFFSLDQFAFYIPGIGYIHNWGAVIDMGGATDGVRPQELGMRMANAAIIGPMYSCPVSNPTTYNLAANHNGPDSTGVPATNNVPQQYAYCFQAGTARSMIVINTDVSAAHAIAFAGPQAPSGTVTVTRYDPASISLTNESTANNPTNTAPQNVSIDAPFTSASLTHDTLPPYSITRYDWTTNGSTLTPSATILTASSAPAAGSPITLQAAVAPATASGSVTFSDGATTLATVPLSDGSAFLTIPALAEGTHTFTATFNGNDTFASSVSTAVLVNALLADTIHLVANPTATPVGGTDLLLNGKTGNPLITGDANLYEAGVALSTVSMVNGKAHFIVHSITPGVHTYSVTYLGNGTYAPSVSLPLVVTASASPAVVTLRAASVQPAIGADDLLTATLSNPLATGTVTFLDASLPVGTATVSAGTASFLVTGITAGNHAYTASYSGDAADLAGTSGLLVVTPVVSARYIHTLFNELPAGEQLDGSAPATDLAASLWSDPNGDWSFASGGGIVSDTPDLSNPVLIDVAHTDYSATFTLPAANAHLLFRFVDLDNTLFVITFAGEIDLYSKVAGADTKIATIYPAQTTGSVTVQLVGTSATLSANGQSASGTIPPAPAGATRLGFLSRADGFVISGLDVSTPPVAGSSSKSPSPIAGGSLPHHPGKKVTP